MKKFLCFMALMILVSTLVFAQGSSDPLVVSVSNEPAFFVTPGQCNIALPDGARCVAKGGRWIRTYQGERDCLASGVDCRIDDGGYYVREIEYDGLGPSNTRKDCEGSAVYQCIGVFNPEEEKKWREENPDKFIPEDKAVGFHRGYTDKAPCEDDGSYICTERIVSDGNGGVVAQGFIRQRRISLNPPARVRGAEVTIPSHLKSESCESNNAYFVADSISSTSVGGCFMTNGENFNNYFVERREGGNTYEYDKDKKQWFCISGECCGSAETCRNEVDFDRDPRCEPGEDCRSPSEKKKNPKKDDEEKREKKKQEQDAEKAKAPKPRFDDENNCHQDGIYTCTKDDKTGEWIRQDRSDSQTFESAQDCVDLGSQSVSYQCHERPDGTFERIASVCFNGRTYASGTICHEKETFDVDPHQHAKCLEDRGKPGVCASYVAPAEPRFWDLGRSFGRGRYEFDYNDGLQRFIEDLPPWWQRFWQGDTTDALLTFVCSSKEELGNPAQDGIILGTNTQSYASVEASFFEINDERELEDGRPFQYKITFQMRPQCDVDFTVELDGTPIFQRDERPLTLLATNENPKIWAPGVDDPELPPWGLIKSKTQKSEVCLNIQRGASCFIQPHGHTVVGKRNADKVLKSAAEIASGIGEGALDVGRAPANTIQTWGGFFTNTGQDDSIRVCNQAVPIGASSSGALPARTPSSLTEEEQPDTGRPDRVDLN